MSVFFRSSTTASKAGCQFGLVQNRRCVSVWQFARFGTMSSGEKDAARRNRDKERFKRTLEKAELSQAQKYLRAQHDIVDSALRETSQSVFSSNSQRKAGANGPVGGVGAGGVIYGGEQVYKPSDPLRVSGSRATLARRNEGEDARRIDFLESRLRRLIEDAPPTRRVCVRPLDATTLTSCPCGDEERATGDWSECFVE